MISFFHPLFLSLAFLYKKGYHILVEIKVDEVKNAALYIDNTTIEGKILEIDKNGRKIFFELKPGSPFSTAEMGKRAELLFEQGTNKYFIAGKIFFQPPSKVIITPETDAEIDKRTETRHETRSLPATISYMHGVFRKKHTIKSTIINLSMKGARLEADEPLNNDLSYEIQIMFPFHHASLEFRASFIVKNCHHYRNIFIHGIVFTDMDMESESNLKKYLFGEKKKF